MRLQSAVAVLILIAIAFATDIRAAAAATPVPPYVKMLDGSTPPVTLPSVAPDNWLLAHIDVETTGLVAGWHEMIDIGLVMTDLEGNVLDSLFVRIQPEHPERLSAGAFAVNAFDAKKWKTMGALSPVDAVDRILAFHKRVAGSKKTLMVAHNCRFDSAFLDHLFRRADHSWLEMYHYYVLDIPSMLWGLGERDLGGDELMKRYNVEDEPHVAEYHTGITGAMVNVRLYRALLQWRKDMLGAAGK